MANDVTLSAAAAAGLLSLFSAPCVLPLVPPYLTFIAGTTIEDVATEKVGRARRDIFPRRGPVRCRFLDRLRGAWRNRLVFRTGVALSYCDPVAARRFRDHCDGAAFPRGSFVSTSVSGKTPRGPKAARALGRLCHGACVRFRLDAVHWADSRRHLGDRRVGSDSCTWRRPFGDLFARPWHSFFYSPRRHSGRSWAF